MKVAAISILVPVYNVEAYLQRCIESVLAQDFEDWEMILVDDVNMKTFLDFFMISKAKAVYLAKGPGMYNSAFAKTAALAKNRPFEVYEY